MEAPAEFQSLGSFESDIFNIINNSHIGQNFCVSPLSIFQVLCLTANGAKDTTLNGMLKALSGQSIKALNEENKKILEICKKANNPIEIANGIFTKFEPLSSFVSIAQRFQSSIEKLVSLQQVNKWCNDKTKGKIPKILDQLTEDMQMILLNAVFFKGQWLKKFEKKNSIERDFFNLGKDPVKVKMMHLNDKFLYYSDNEVQVIELKYKTENISSLIILPKKEIEINNYIKSFNAEKINKIIKGLKQRKVEISLPKFEINDSVKLKEQLIKMGMDKAFDKNDANFSGIQKSNDIYIYDVFHKTHVKMDEEGTVAAAATAVVMVRKMAVIPKKENNVIMIVERPFIFTIRNSSFPENHSLLFMGKIEKL